MRKSAGRLSLVPPGHVRVRWTNEKPVSSHVRVGWTNERPTIMPGGRRQSPELAGLGSLSWPTAQSVLWGTTAGPRNIFIIIILSLNIFIIIHLVPLSLPPWPEGLQQALHTLLVIIHILGKKIFQFKVVSVWSEV